VNGLLAAAGAHKAATAVLAVAVIAGGGVVHAVTDDTTTATVTKVVDGDTIDVRYDGEIHRVRLLNINTPESVDPDKPVECMGPQASEYLTGRLPVGTAVRLERDQEKQDEYGRELAAVFLGDELIDAEIARAGYGIAMSVGPSTKYLAPVRTAQAEAQAAGRGLHSTSLECTIPAQVSALEAAATAALAEAPTSNARLAAYDSYAGELAAVIAAGKSLTSVLTGPTDAFPMLAHTSFEITTMQGRVATTLSRLTMAVTSNRTARAAEQKRLDDAARKAAEEAARKAAEEAARKAAEAAEKAAAEAAQKAAEEAAAEAARQAAAQAASRRTSSSTRSSSGSSGAARTSAPAARDDDSGSGSSGGSSGYTGCRSYAPGGKTWTPIAC
jgi:micrococcal nuclease